MAAVLHRAHAQWPVQRRQRDPGQQCLRAAAGFPAQPAGHHLHLRGRDAGAGRGAAGAAGPARPVGRHSANRLGTTLRRIRGGRFMVRSAYSYEAEQPLERMAGQLRASFQRRYPQLAAHDFEYVWSGSTALTGNGASFVGEVRPGFTPPLAAMARASSRARSTAACWPSASPASAAPCWMTWKPWRNRTGCRPIRCGASGC